MNKNKLLINLRWIILAVFLILISVAAYMHQVLGGNVAPSIHALCPFGGIESLYTFFLTGSFISKIFSGTLILFAITLVLAIAFRRSFCGLICPFGAMQEFFAKLGQKLFGRKFIVPSKIDKPLRYLKYVLLIVTVYYAWRTAGLWMAPYDPWSAYAHLPEGLEAVWESTAIGLILLVITILGSAIYDRFFCKYLCPMGALYGLIGKISPFRIVRNKDKCINCNLCSKKCPVNIDVATSKEVKSAECISCQTCVLNCPKAGALEIKEGNKTVKPFLVIVMVLALFFVPIFISQAFGVYNLLPKKIAAGQTIGLSEIKGFMSIEEVAKDTGIEIKDVYKKLQIPENVPSTTKMKEISKIAPGYDFEKVKGALEAASGTENATTKINVEAVVGSMSIKKAAEAVKLDTKEFYKLFKIPENVHQDTLMKDIGKLSPGYDYHKIKESMN